MDADPSLMWHGPLWYAGFRPAELSGAIPGLRTDEDLLTHFQAGSHPSGALPSAIAVTPTLLGTTTEQSAFFQWLDALVSGLACEVPLILFIGPEDVVPERPRADAVIHFGMAPQHVFERVCALQRNLLRFEEARVRRLVFGRLAGSAPAPHHSGPSGLLVIGVGHRFLELEATAEDKVDVVGAFDQRLAEDYLKQRAFDAVILDGGLPDALETLRQLRFDARFATLPVLVFSSGQGEAHALVEAGATDVLPQGITAENLKARMRVLIRAGKRRRLADRILAESRKWLMQTASAGGVPESVYQAYLDRTQSGLELRGLRLEEVWLAPAEGLPGTPSGESDTSNVFATLMTIADATSREEDLVCVVAGKGPVAVLKSDRGKARIMARINAILSHTVF
ncbi:hypothetical protein GCM10011316_16620 [Roseibium aquae]|uniref:Response regulatory domain-containing protein n=1 Tax=Roseibium aquae TaxID=1323746 RepID=A0A916THI7_9HYPH|nr:response regulator transcription factor [Roseibium aquae]GGB45264.1 hypothetical protein GCM10011316_16620 [Roseibium aquae]